MIRSFSFDGKRIPLLPSPSLGSNGETLFAADSMTLLVGPNGSGKTRALASLVSIFAHEKKDKNIPTHIEWNSQKESLETCAVYYTPVPYRIDIPSNGNRFRSIQTGLSSAKQPLSVRHREITNELENEFGLDARITLSLASLSPVSFSEIMTRVLSTRHSATNAWTEPFRVRYRQYEKKLTNIRLNDVKYSSPEYESIMGEREKILGDFTIALNENIGQEFHLKVRAYQFARQGRAPSLSAERQLLEGLGFVFSETQNKPTTVPRRKFETAIKQLREVAEIIRDPSLAKNTYQLDDAQVEQLEALSLDKLGQVTLTGLSSGAAALIHQFSSIKIACEELLNNGENRRLLLLIDEGDAFLHFGWQQHYVDYLDKTVSRLKQRFDSVQVLIASHSPFLMSDFPRECIFLLNSRDWIEDLLGGENMHTPSSSFGAPLDAVVRHVGQAGTMGTFATRIIRQLVKDIADGIKIKSRRVEMIDDPVIKRQIVKVLDERKLWVSEE
ncbi:MAG TPA: ATP-binding protein [Pseudomonas oleovorans]|nr:ATP-binding protein [Pseudomonas oleovorans]